MRLRLSALCLLAFHLPLAGAESITQLEPATAPAQSEGEVSGFAFRAYRFHARAGQYYRIELDNPDVDFSLMPVRRGDKMPGGAEGYIPQDGEYELRILQKRDAAQSGQSSRYRLTLTVNDQHSDKADAASRSSHIRFASGSLVTTEKGRLQGKAEDTYRFFANQGQRLQMQLEGQDILASLHYLGRENPELDAREQLLPLGGQYELRLALSRAAQRRNKLHDYHFTLTLFAESSPGMTVPAMPAAANTVQPPPAQPTTASSSPAKQFFVHYQCAGEHRMKVHYVFPPDEAARATLYFAERQYHLAQSERHSTPLQAVFYGKGHYLTLNTPKAAPGSQIMLFTRRKDGNEETLLAQCLPQLSQ